MKNSSQLNKERAERGAEILAAYQLRNDTDEPAETILVNVLTDLMHAAADQEIDVPKLFRLAVLHFDAEQRGES